MADLTITVANVAIAGSDARVKVVQAGEAVTEGQAVYRSTSDGKYYKGVNDSLAASKVAGVSITDAAADGYFLLQTDGAIEPGATLTKGQLYYLSATAGGIAPYADLAASDYVTAIYRATSTTLAKMAIDVTETLL